MDDPDLKISRTPELSVPGGEPAYELPPPPGRGRRRAAAMIVAALVLLAAFVAAAPYVSSALKEGYSILSGVTNTGPGTGTSTGQTTGYAGQVSNCSSAVSVRALSAPDIEGGSADVAYPPDYCTLAAYALAQVNADRAANGTGPVALGYNQAAQQHADSMLYYGYFSHFDTQGYKPYMRYSLMGGRGADFENVAFLTYSIPHYFSSSEVEGAIQSLEHAMVYNDVACCNNGHRYNILNPLHNIVSIGVAYNSTTVFFDEEFENDYITLSFAATDPAAPSPYYVTMTGTPIPSAPTPTSIFISYDGEPTAQTPAQLNAGPHEYGPGNLVGGVLPQSGYFGGCGRFTTGTTVCADQWKFSSASMDISFSLEPFVRNYGPGVYTIFLVTGSSTDTALTTISVFVA